MPRFWQSAVNITTPSVKGGLPIKSPPEPKGLRAWYKQRVHKFNKLEKQPSREDDYREAKEKFGAGISHVRMRAIRADLAPHWTQRGRPPKKIG